MGDNIEKTPMDSQEADVDVESPTNRPDGRHSKPIDLLECWKRSWSDVAENEDESTKRKQSSVERTKCRDERFLRGILIEYIKKLPERNHASIVDAETLFDSHITKALNIPKETNKRRPCNLKKLKVSYAVKKYRAAKRLHKK